MEFLKAILLGIVQGLTEFLPISSSGHLLLFERIFNLTDHPFSLAIILHGATSLSLLFYFRKELKSFIKNKQADKRFFLLIFSSLLPLLISGPFLKMFLEGLSQETSLQVIKTGFLLTGGLLLSLPFFPQNQKLEMKDITLKQALLIGCIQCLAALPGFSRSGWTICAGLFLGLKPRAAIGFSFLIGLPATLAPVFLKLWQQEIILIDPAIIISSFLSSFLAGILALYLILKLFQKKLFHLFGFYLLALALYLICF